MSISVLRALGGISFTEKKASLLHDLDKAVRNFISTNNFEEIIRDAKEKNTPINQRIAANEFRRLSKDANLRLRYPQGKDNGSFT
jgi:biotin-(acetyl-CoA carboxylase) ligase